MVHRGLAATLLRFFWGGVLGTTRHCLLRMPSCVSFRDPRARRSGTPEFDMPEVCLLRWLYSALGEMRKQRPHCRWPEGDSPVHLQAGSLRAHRRSFRRFVNDGAEFERSLGTQHGAHFF